MYALAAINISSPSANINLFGFKNSPSVKIDPPDTEIENIFPSPKND